MAKLTMGRHGGASLGLLGAATIVLVVLIVTMPGQAHGFTYNITAILEGFKIGYDRRIRPNYGGQPVEVEVSPYILSFSELSDKTMDVSLDMYFRQTWNEPRLAFQRREGLEELVVGADFLSELWVPDTFFVNEKEAYFHQATTENQFVRISYNGDILRSMRVTIKFSCPLDLRYFPMDIQLCTLEIESFGYRMSDLKYRWKDSNQLIAPDAALPQFSILGFRQRTVEASLSSGNYSRLLLDVVFNRHVGYYLTQVYIPSTLIVFMSWLSFWISGQASTARTLLGVTSVLSMTTLMGSVVSTLPKITYITSMDLYLGVCFFMVFGSLIEFALVNYANNQSANDEDNGGQAQEEDGGKATFSIRDPGQASQKIFGMCCKKTGAGICGVSGDTIDAASRILFPFSFLFFHVVYWGYFLNNSQENIPGLIQH